jgi:hypothetical protein
MKTFALGCVVGIALVLFVVRDRFQVTFDRDPTPASAWARYVADVGNELRCADFAQTVERIACGLNSNTEQP